MKRLFLMCIWLLALAACAPQPFSPPTAATSSQNQPLPYAVGSSANTTTAFDGTYAGIAIQNISTGNALPNGGDGTSACPNYQTPPALTIYNGLAQFQALNLTFQGYVTPQGGLVMRTGLGHHFEGQIDNQNVLKGRMIAACIYGASWQRTA